MPNRDAEVGIVRRTVGGVADRRQVDGGSSTRSVLRPLVAAVGSPTVTARRARRQPAGRLTSVGRRQRPHLALHSHHTQPTLQTIKRRGSTSRLLRCTPKGGVREYRLR